MSNLLEAILSEPTALDPCPGGCDHSEAEHYAFDSGCAAGERGEDDEVCPYEGGGLREAWLSGHSVGAMNFENCKTEVAQ